MPQPSASDVRINVPLTNISIAYIQDATAFIADDVFPIVPVERQGDAFAQYDRTYWFRDGARLRNAGAESAGGGFAVNFDGSYFCRAFGIHKDIDDMVRANALAPIDMDRDATEWITQQLLVRREVEWASRNFTTGVWSLDKVGVAATPTGTEFLQWSQAASTPIEDIRAQIVSIAGTTGYRPNKLVISPTVYKTLIDHPEFQDRVKYTVTGAFVDADLMAKVWGLDQVLVGWSVKDSSVESTSDAGDSIGFVMGDAALLVYANPAPSILKPSGGYTFSWVGYLGAGNAGNRIKSFRMEQLNSDRVEGEIAFDPKVVAPDMGVFFTNCV